MFFGLDRDRPAKRKASHMEWNASLLTLTRRSVPADAYVRVQQSVQRLRSLRQLLAVPLLQRLGERVEQRPDRPPLELFMPRLPPLLQDFGDVRVGANAHVDGANHKIMHRLVVDFGLLVGADAGVLVMPEI